MSEDYKTLKEQIAVETKIKREVSDTIYGYYLKSRPPMPGCAPTGYFAAVSLKYQTYHPELCRCVWGWIGYSRALSQEEVDQYELYPDENNPGNYRRYAIEKVSMKIENGKKKMSRALVRDAEDMPVTTFYKSKAIEIMTELNDHACKELNTATSLTKYFVKEIYDTQQ